MSATWETSLPPVPATYAFTSDWITGALQSYRIKLELGPGIYQISVLPDLVVVSSAQGAPTSEDANFFLPEAFISSAYITRTVDWYDATGIGGSGDNLIALLASTPDSLAYAAMTDAGYESMYDGFNYYSATVTLAAEQTVTYPSGARDIYTDDYYLNVYGWNLSYPREPDGASIALSGRFLVATGNPTGQRTTAWGGDWLNVQSVFEDYDPPVVTPPDDNSGLPADEAVVLYGDTPELLSAYDPAIAAGTAFLTAADMATSPEISLQADGSWQYGELAGHGASDLYETLKAATIGAAKGLLGEALADQPYAGYSLQAWEAYELGTTINDKVERSIDFISSGLDVLQGRLSLAEWEAEHQAFMADTQNEFDALAASATVGKIPLVGWILAPVAEHYLKLNYKLQNTHSFEIGVAAGASLTGGDLGGILLGGSQDEQISAGNGAVLASGGSGNDNLLAGTGTQFLLGDTGTDVAVFAGARAQHDLAQSGTHWLVSGGQGSHTLGGIERLQFADAKIALDLLPTQAGGQTLEFIGVLAADLVANPSIVGTILPFFDGGYSLAGLCQYAIDIGLVGQLAGSNSNEDLVRLAFRNVVGTEADAGTVATLTGYMNGIYASYSQADFLATVAGLELNQQHIDLAGLQQTGVDYL